MENHLKKMTKTIKDFLNDESKNETLLDTTKYGLKAFSEMLKESNGSIPKLKKSLTQSTKTNKSITNLNKPRYTFRSQ